MDKAETRHAVWDSSPATLCSQVPVANAKLSIGLKVAASLSLSHPCILADNAAADGNIIAVRPTPPLSSPSSECLEFYPWNTMAVDRPSPSHCSAPLSSGLFKEWSATQQLFTALLFRQNRFSNSPFYCGLTLHCENPIHSLQLFGA